MARRKVAAFLTLGVVVASLAGSFVFLGLFVPSASRTEVLTMNETGAEASFTIDSSFRDGVLIVPGETRI